MSAPPGRSVAYDRDLLLLGAKRQLLIAIQVFERLDPDSLAVVEARADWSLVRSYSLNAAGENHGVLLMTHGWRPAAFAGDRTE